MNETERGTILRALGHIRSGLQMLEHIFDPDPEQQANEPTGEPAQEQGE